MLSYKVLQNDHFQAEYHNISQWNCLKMIALLGYLVILTDHVLVVSVVKQHIPIKTVLMPVYLLFCYAISFRFIYFFWIGEKTKKRSWCLSQFNNWRLCDVTQHSATRPLKSFISQQQALLSFFHINMTYSYFFIDNIWLPVKQS